MYLIIIVYVFYESLVFGEPHRSHLIAHDNFRYFNAESAQNLNDITILGSF